MSILCAICAYTFPTNIATILSMSKIETYLKTNPPTTPAVVGFFIKEDTVLLGLRKKTSTGLGDQLISGVGGKLEEGETAEDALKREFKEEIDSEVISFREMGTVTFWWSDKPKWNQHVTIYLIDTWVGEPHETDVIRPSWFDKNKLPLKQMWEDNNYWVPAVLNNKKVNGVFLYDENSKISEYTLTED